MFVPARRAGRIAGFVGLTSIMLPAFVVRQALARERTPVRDAWVKAWTGALLGLFGVDVDLSPPGSPFEAGRGHLLVSNHRSAIDIAVVLRAFGGHMVSRADLSGWPLLGAAARSVGTVFVDRSSTVSGASAIREMRRLLDDGETVILFPEGTTFEGDLVRPFHAGSFIAALRTSARIIPVGIAYPRGSETAFVEESFSRHLYRMSGAGRTRVALRVGEAITVTPGVKAAELAALTRSAVQALVNEGRAAVDA